MILPDSYLQTMPYIQCIHILFHLLVKVAYSEKNFMELSLGQAKVISKKTN